ncbi:MAG: hypothetical protein U0360_06050 [Dehalococcoidia bacterium]
MTSMRAVLLPPAVLFLAFVGLPLVLLAWRAASDGTITTQLQAPEVRQALVLSLATSTLTLVLALALVTPLAYLLARGDFPDVASSTR